MGDAAAGVLRWGVSIGLGASFAWAYHVGDNRGMVFAGILWLVYETIVADRGTR